jgi:hypothetical protein
MSKLKTYLRNRSQSFLGPMAGYVNGQLLQIRNARYTSGIRAFVFKPLPRLPYRLGYFLHCVDEASLMMLSR